MTVKYFALLTNLGAAKLANAAALGTQLQITQMAVGDGGGALPTPSPAQTQLIGEKRRAALNSLSIDEASSSQIIAEQVIPETDGGWWIREIGLFDKDGILIAIANCPDTYKPQLQEGSGRTQTVRMVLIVSSTEAVTLKIDPSVVLATRKYADDKAIEVRQYADGLLSEHETSRNHPDGSLVAKGFVQLSNSANSTSEVLAATPKAVKAAYDAALKAANNLSDLSNAQAALANLTLTTMGIGLPSMTSISNFDFQNFVFTSGANYLVYSSSWLNAPAGVSYPPAGLVISIKVDYVSGNTAGLTLIPSTSVAANFNAYKIRINGVIGSRTFNVIQSWNSAIAVPILGGGTGATTAAGALTNLGLGDGSLVPIGIPLPYPLATAPTGFLKCNGSSFSTTTYPLLAAAYPSGVLPDMRANAIRGWDDGRGIDTGRALLSEQLDALQNFTGTMIDMITSSNPSGTGVFSITNNISGYTDQTVRSGRIINYKFDPSLVARTATETRMRNIAFNYIVRAI